MPAKIVPNKIDKKVPVSTSAFPVVNSCFFKVCGSKEYFTGPKNADCVPAFITSELKTAFQIGFMLFLPFLIIDLVVASVLMAMGMMMLSPMIVSLPFKLMLFVLVDGWNLILSTLAASFG